MDVSSLEQANMTKVSDVINKVIINIFVREANLFFNLIPLSLNFECVYNFLYII